MENKSIWEDTVNIGSYPKLDHSIKTDVLVIGGGITGILCASELKKRGHEVVLVEQKRIGGGITKNTTAFISALHETLYQDVVHKYGYKYASDYLRLNLMAIEEYKKLSQKYDFDFKECPSTMFTAMNDDVILKEKKILDSLNYHTELIESLPLEDVSIKLGIRFNNQGRLNPLKLINALAEDLSIYEETRITKLQRNVAYTEKYRIEFNNVIVATHYPFINRFGLYFLKLRQRISYIVSLNHKEIDGTYCSIDSGLYFRGYDDNLIIGGYDRDTKEPCNKMFLKRISSLYGFNQINYSWTNQDVMTLDGIPYIGKYSLMRKNWFVATGFNMWGFTWAMVSSKVLSDMIEGKEEIKLISPNRSIWHKQLFINIGTTIVNMLKIKKPRCTHLKVALKYNKIDKTWECPAHGSRYDDNFNVINDPAVKK